MGAPGQIDWLISPFEDEELNRIVADAVRLAEKHYADATLGNQLSSVQRDCARTAARYVVVAMTAESERQARVVEAAQKWRDKKGSASKFPPGDRARMNIKADMDLCDALDAAGSDDE